MASDNYPGMEESMPSSNPESAPSEQSATETTLIPKSMFGDHDPKPGEVYDFKVVRIHEDEVEVEYSTGHEEGEKDMDTPEAAFDKAMGGNPGGSEGGY